MWKKKEIGLKSADVMEDDFLLNVTKENKLKVIKEINSGLPYSLADVAKTRDTSCPRVAYKYEIRK